jgi:hypothetical protein
VRSTKTLAMVRSPRTDRTTDDSGETRSPLSGVGWTDPRAIFFTAADRLFRAYRTAVAELFGVIKRRAVSIGGRRADGSRSTSADACAMFQLRPCVIGLQ